MSLDGQLSKLKISSENHKKKRIAKKSKRGKSERKNVKREELLRLIRDDHISTASKIIKSTPDIADQFPLEVAYIHYRRRKFSSVLKIADKFDGYAMKLIAAQTYFFLEVFDKCIFIYEQLLRSNDTDEQDKADIFVNYVAAKAMVGETVDVTGSGQSYDLLFNLSFAYLHRKEYDECVKLLNEAIAVCKMTSDMTTEQMSSELNPMYVQLAYVHLLKGDKDQCNTVLEAITQNRDEFLKLSVNTMKLAIDQPENPFQALEMLQSRIKSQVLYTHNSLINRNKALYLARCGQHSALTKMTYSPHQELSVNNTTPISAVVKILDAFEQSDDDDLLHFLKTYVRAHKELHGSEFRKDITLLKMQYYINKSNWTQARRQYRALAGSSLESNASVYDILGQISDKSHTKSRSWLYGQADNTLNFLDENLYNLFALCDNETKMTKVLFESRPKSFPATPMGIVATSVWQSIDKAEEMSSSLPSVEELTSSIDVTNLLSAGLAKPVSTTADIKTEPSTIKPDRETKIKGKLPKNYDPNRQPDPERWLPMRDRSYYKPKRKDRKKVLGATQGAGKVSEDLAVSAVPKAKTSTASVSKKKKKGKR
ncbi:hypothetical protein CANCADRAFT_71127 [Tortispora caseinolytica NRRL Y-17796]|uniref:Signal recognition particle subunit SRP72 n=1 Tax=Tortispora caseinolytica NRRL Y-17796 TaxID=767744 RepID=A0A1E4TIE7_9ASCO|nr:hypothetical protein CANCADRAFT_71127 [Tortispora caseinolytica NRRL Y-17796]